MSALSSKLSRVRSVKLSAFSNHRRSPSPNPPQQQQATSPPPPPPAPQPKHSPPSIPRSRTLSNNARANSFGDTLRAISKEARSGEFADVYDVFFFSDKRCQNRAFFMAARLKQTLHGRSHLTDMDDHVWERMTHRLYTMNYILFVLPSTCELRARFLASVERDLACIGDGQHVLRRGGMEVHFAVRYCLRRLKAQHLYGYDDDEIEQVVERAREVIEHCLESESKLGHAERDAMYVFHGLRMGLHGRFEPHIDLEEDHVLAERLQAAVNENKQAAKPAYVNPFEDEDAVVTDDDDMTTPSHSREVDSGFYDNFVPPKTVI